MAGNEMTCPPEQKVRAQALRGKGRAAEPIQYVVLDRDGTLIRHVPYLSRPEQVEVLPGVVAGLTELRKAGCKLFLHTNQSGIGRGYFSLEEALAVAARIGARRTLLVHMGHDIEHAAVSAALPAGVELAYDGLSVPLA